MNLKSSIAKVFSANFLQLVSSVIIGFIVPSILSIQGYADLKTYTLYISYIGFFSLGFLDGLYIKYGGRKLEDINKSNLKGEHNFLVILQLVISIVLILISFIKKDIILFLLGISILPIMIAAFHKNIFQATGNFDKYSKIIYIYSFSYMILNVILAIFFKNQNYIYYCLTTLGANLISIIVIEFKFLYNFRVEKTTISRKDIINNIKVGFFILLGNLSVVALFGIDKLFVKIFLTTEDFAYYSFAVSMLNIINVLVNAISVTFYNYLFSNNNSENINKLKRYLIALGGAASLGFFALSFIVCKFITKYIPSLDIIAITFAVFPYMILINALYVNLYKVDKNEKKYFKVVFGILIISIIYNIIAIIIFKNTISVAFATILTLITWVIYSTRDLEKVVNEINMYIYMFLLTISFLICAHYFNWIYGGIIYFIIYLIATYFFNKEVLTDIKNTSLRYLKRIIYKKR